MKLASADVPGTGSWAAGRLVRLLEQAADGARLVEGLEYARLGQTVRLNFEPGSITASVQGRLDRAHRTSIALSTFAESKWESVVQAMTDQAVYAAKLLAGELPATVEDLFAPMQLRLFPAEPADLTPVCTCGDQLPWCKHACCIVYLLAERLTKEPFLIFHLRGIPGEDLLEKIRQRRVVAGAIGGSVPVYPCRVAGVSDAAPVPLEESLATFWEVGPGLDELNLPVEEPAVRHPLLRRLGPSPLADVAPARPGQTSTPKFPMVGLLATCYELVSESVIREATAAAVEAAAEPGTDPDPGPEVGDSGA